MIRISLFSILILLALCILTPVSDFVVRAEEPRPLGGTPPSTMVDEGVTSFDMVPPVIVWADSYICDIEPTLANTPQDYDEPEHIYRIPTYRGFIREIFKQEHDDPNECNPYKIHSNIVFDGEYIYWADDSGLVRLPQTANVGDVPELVASVAQSTRNDDKVEIVDGGEHIYAITYVGTNISSLWQIRKSDGIWQLVDHFTGTSDALDLSFDGDYFYWIFGTFLYKGTPDTLDYGFITAAVTGYHAEGYRMSCRTTCSETHYVFIAQGDEVIRYNNLNGNFTTGLYQSVTPDYTIYDLVTDSNFIFLLEYKIEGGLPIPTHTYHLVRAEKVGNDWGYLYDKVIAAQKPVLKNLHTDNTYIYWQDTDQLLKLPNDAEALPYINLSIYDVEVTQGVQSAANGVPLIRGKHTFVRLVPQADGEAVDWVTAHLELLEDDGTPMNVTLLPISGMYVKAEPTPSPTVLDSHLLFEVPASLVDGNNFRFRVTLNPYNEPPELDTDLGDNVVNAIFSLVSSPELTIDLFRLGYEVNGVQYTNHPGLGLTKEWIRQAYPLAYNDLHVIEHSLDWGEALGTRVNQTHPDCAAYANDDKDKCASDFAYNALYWMRHFSGSDNVYYGLISDGARFVRGQGGDGVAVGPAGTGTWGWDYDGAYTDWYTAHEVGHAVGLAHPVPGSVECEHSASDPNYPYADAQIGPGGNQIMGLRRYNTGLDIKYELYSDDGWHDMMSYCDYYWISDYSFNRLRSLLNLNRQQSLTFAPAGQELLGVFGVLHTELETASIQILQQFDSGAAIPPLVPGDYAIRLLDEPGAVLAEYAFTPQAAEGDTTTLNFGQIVDWVIGTARIQIIELASGAVWAETAVSANPPQVSDVTLVNPPNPVTGEVTLQWTAVDADNDPLTFDIFYSVDDGLTWQPLMMSLAGSSASIDTSTLSGGDGIFRVSANDGVHTQTANSPTYQMADKPPVPVILSPADGSTFQWGQTIDLFGEAIDYQTGMVDESGLRWWVNGEQVGIGSTVSVNNWLVGENEIQLVAVSSRQLTAATTIHITVHDNLELPGPDLAVGPTAVGWHVAAGETAGQSRQLTILNVGGGDLRWEASENASWLALSASAGDTPQTITLSAMPGGLGGGQQLVTNLTIRGYDSEDNLVETAVIPITLSAGNTWQTGPGNNPSPIFLPIIFRP